MNSFSNPIEVAMKFIDVPNCFLLTLVVHLLASGVQSTELRQLKDVFGFPSPLTEYDSAFHIEYAENMKYLYRMCTPEESWTGGCVAGDTCMYFLREVHCNKAPADFRISYREHKVATPYDLVCNANEFHYLCPSRVSSFCHVLMLSTAAELHWHMHGKVLSNDRSCGSLYRCDACDARELFSSFELYSAEVLTKSVLQIDVPLPQQERSEFFNGYGKFSAEVEFKARDLTGLDTEINGNKERFGDSKPTHLFKLWSNDTPPDSDLLHGRLSLTRHYTHSFKRGDGVIQRDGTSHRIYRDYIIYDEKKLIPTITQAVDMGSGSTCSPGITKLSCTVTIDTKYKNITGLRVRAVLKDLSGTVRNEGIGQGTATASTTLVQESGPLSGQHYNCIGSVLYRFTTNTVKELEISQTTQSNVTCHCGSQNSDPCGLGGGVKKCGTEAVRKYLKIHPDMAVRMQEVHYFDRYRKKTLEWYRSQMPLST